MNQILLSGEQFRQLVAGHEVSLGCCQIKLGDVGFKIVQVAQVPVTKPSAKRRPQLVKPLK